MAAPFNIMQRQPGPALNLGGFWLFVSPHDDDALIGGGLLMQAVSRAQVVIVSDGRMGYTAGTGPDEIVPRRKHEAERAYAALGAGMPHFMGFPDGSLARHCGSRLEDGKPAGLENALAALLRKLKPEHVVTTDPADWHPDHRATFESVRMALFHACGEIWPELGPPLPAMPSLYTFPVYAPLASLPDYCIEAPAQAVKRRAEALACFASQADVVARLGEATAADYLRRIPTEPFNAAEYRRLFT